MVSAAESGSALGFLQRVKRSSMQHKLDAVCPSDVSATCSIKDTFFLNDANTNEKQKSRCWRMGLGLVPWIDIPRRVSSSKQNPAQLFASSCTT